MHLNNLFNKKSFDSSWVINQQLLIIDIQWFSITCNETENIDLVLTLRSFVTGQSCADICGSGATLRSGISGQRTDCE